MRPNQRFCLTLDLQDDPEIIREYEHWHQKDHLWPEIPAGIKAAGILHMEIYRFENHLFMIMEGGPDFDFTRDMERLGQLPRQAEWEAFVAQFQKAAMNQSSKDKWKQMKKIFTLD